MITLAGPTSSTTHTSPSRKPANDYPTVAAHFVVSGVRQAASAWLAGNVNLESNQLVSLLDELADPYLYRPRLTRTTTSNTTASSAPAATNLSG
ncbi:hypothetical protein [Mycobacterium uberis]|uniref:hypothetical protein n=1 Tax=Mycobacterium uberis TaxID=2162698 RepID=UPI001A9F3FC4